MRMQHNLRNACVSDVEQTDARQWEPGDEREDHANDAAVRSDADGFAGVPLDDVAHTRFDARPELIAGFAVDDCAAFDVLEPVGSASAEFFQHSFKSVPGPIAEIDFAQIVDDDLFYRAVFQKWNESFLNALHWAGIERVELPTAEPIRENDRLFVAASGQGHVDASAEHAVVSDLDFGMPDQDQASGGCREPRDGICRFGN